MQHFPRIVMIHFLMSTVVWIKKASVFTLTFIVNFIWVSCFANKLVKIFACFSCVVVYFVQILSALYVASS